MVTSTRYENLKQKFHETPKLKILIFTELIFTGTSIWLVQYYWQQWYSKWLSVWTCYRCNRFCFQVIIFLSVRLLLLFFKYNNINILFVYNVKSKTKMSCSIIFFSYQFSTCKDNYVNHRSPLKLKSVVYECKKCIVNCSLLEIQSSMRY